jgi:ankyrin repeat protein
VCSIRDQKRRANLARPRTALRAPSSGKPETASETAHDWARSGDIDKLLHIPRGGHAVRATDADGRTALHAAVATGQFDATRVLLSLGSDPNAADSAGETPLHVAARGGQLHVTQALLKAGADRTARATSGDCAGRTPGEVATAHGKAGCASLLGV